MKPAWRRISPPCSASAPNTMCRCMSTLRRAPANCRWMWPASRCCRSPRTSWVVRRASARCMSRLLTGGCIQAQQLGGGHERGLACRHAGNASDRGLRSRLRAGSAAAGEAQAARLRALRDRLWLALRDLPGAMLNGHPEARAPGILNVTFAGVEGESLFAGLEELTLSTGSACNSRSGEPSYVLRALGRDTAQAQSSLRRKPGLASTRRWTSPPPSPRCSGVHTLLWNQSPARPVPLQGWEGVADGHVLGEAGALRVGNMGCDLRRCWKTAG